MIDLFRFLMLRPANLADESDYVEIQPSPRMAEIIEVANQSENPQVVLQNFAEEFIASEAFVHNPDQLSFRQEMLQLQQRIRDIEGNEAETLQQLIVDIFGVSAQDLTRRQEFAAEKDRVFDSLIALKLKSDEQTTKVSDLVNLGRMFAMVDLVSEKSSKLDKAGAVKRLLNANIVLPESVFPLILRATQVGDQAQGVFLAMGAFPPLTRGNIKPVGLGDLLVVKQFLKRYQGGEVSHIENVLKSESRTRVTRRLEKTEQTFLVETETTKEEERDLQTTERFSLQREASNVIKTDSSLKTGVALSGSYGPAVELKSNLDYATSDAQEQSTKQATTFSKDVTSRAASKVTERIKEQRTQTIIEEFEEKNQHGFENNGGNADHIIGVYQWVDKVYEAQVYNYGQRLMFDVMVPEPATYLRQVLDQKESLARVSNLIKPEPFNLKPNEITETNYLEQVAKYKVSGVEPPPKEYVTISKSFEGKNDSNKAIDVLIPDGYQAVSAYCIHNRNASSINSEVSITVGNQAFVNLGYHPLPPGADPTRTSEFHSSDKIDSLNEEVVSIPVSVFPFGVSLFVVSIEIKCQRTPRRLAEWQIKTYDAILQAYLKLQSDYENAVAAAKAEHGVVISGQNPGQNRMLEKTELKKACISILTEQHYDWLGAIETTAEGWEQTDLSLAQVQGSYIRFFEQAFEWEHMMYLFYPYFWGRKKQWRDWVLTSDTDPLFAEFLKAGSARVVFPVRLGFEEAVIHFLETGKIWNGGGPPPINSKMYVSIIKEIQERQGAPDKETPQGDPWDVKVPTTLVRLRKDGSLPKWKKINDEWVEDDTTP